MAQFPSVIQLSTLNGTTGFRIDGIAAGDRSGYSVASAGDVNGDGFADILIGANAADPGGDSAAGSSYVVFGKASSFAATFDLATLNGSNGFRLDGVAAADFSGQSVTSAGDINGDGFADILIGAYGADPDGYYGSGSSYVVFGKASGFAASLDLSTLNGTNGFRLDGGPTGGKSGESVASAGDVNGDGFADILIGSSNSDPGGDSNAGSSYVVFGKASGFAATLNLSTLNGANGFRIDGDAANDQSGRSVASAGDINGDGFADILIGAFGADPGGDGYAGSSYVVFGKATVFATTLNLSTLNGSDGFRLDGGAANDFSGTSVTAAGDVNGDGFADILIGANGADPGGDLMAGSSYVVFGKASSFAATLDLATLNGSTGFRLDGAAAYDFSGASVTSAGDVNGDGFADILIGVFGADPGGVGYAGSSYVVFGKASGFAATLDLNTLNGTNGFRLEGVASDDQSGRSVTSAGDVNGDGFADILIGAKGVDPGGDSNAGASYVVFGRKPDVAVTRTGTAADQTLAGGDFADTLSGLGGQDRLFGHGGADTLFGGTYSDSLKGGDGDDHLHGGTGKDALSGGVGADKFYFNTTLNASTNVDKISGISSIDKIVVDNDIFTGLGTDFTLSEFRSIATGTSFAEVDTSDNIIYLKATGDLYYDRDGSGTTYSAIKFADLAANSTVNFSHFLLVE